VDLDAFVTRHHPEWARLEHLVRQRRLSGAEADEILDRYQRVATHLSLIRSSAPDPSTVAYLSSLLARARSRSAGTRSHSWSDLATFFTATFPGALYEMRRWWIVTALANVAAAFLLGWWLLAHPRIVASRVSAAEISQLVHHEVEGYYSEYAASHFASQVWTNNAQVAALCVALGVLGVPVVLVLWRNTVNVALIGSIMADHGRGGLFFGLILPHGLLELTAVFVAGGVGLRLFWSWVVPGSRTRGQSIAAAGRSSVVVVLGLVVVLLVSGIIEAFVTPSGLPTWARIGIGVVAEIAFLTYVFTLGRWAHRRGEIGDVSAQDAGDTLPAAG
jgi:uncharacterized membrane protein SpoIIM required for sporulation